MSKINFGTAGYIGFIVAGGTVALLPNYTNFDFNTTGSQVDTTSGSATWDTHLPSRQNWDAALEMFFDDSASPNTGGTADLAKFVANVTGVLVVAPLGTATGKPKYGGSVTVGKHDKAMPFADPLGVKMTFKGNGQPYWNDGSAF